MLHAVFEPGDENVHMVPAVLSAPYGILGPRLVVQVIDARILADSQESLCMHHTDDDVPARLKCRQFAIPTIRLFLIMMHLFANPHLCYPENPDMAEPTREQTEQYFMPAAPIAGHISVPKVQMYREAVRDADGKVVAYRFFWFILDDSMDLNRGISALIAANRRPKKPTKIKPTEVQIQIHSLVSQPEWIDRVLKNYDPSFHVDRVTYIANLMAAQNAANVYERLSLQTSMALLPETAADVYKDTTRYVSVADQIYTYMFPTGADRMAPLMQHPEVQYKLRLFENEASRDWERNLTDAHKRKIGTDNIYLTRNRIGIENKPDMEDLLDDLKRYFEEDMRTMAPDEKQRYRASQPALDRFEQIFAADADVAPSIKAVVAWHKNERRKAEAEGHPWSIMYEANIIDPTLTTFGNMVTRYMLGMEATMNVSAIHEEIFMCYVASRGAFEVAPELKFNVIFYGPPESGKSYATACMQKVSIKGTFENVSVQTARADATEVNLNGTVMCRDELPPDFFGENGSAEEKERLTTGLITTVQW